ncbi:divalent-cation tolerance protein CutA [Desulfovibrio mangrovi]|uniref:divalent-cation tolerance protein CutA n=1 Tax=Desulfovibrio mangrovi TaxID=2976983 RepID=UPI0022452F49|nr:divalent-cation tolerance protein CutA [Desulfovibrio mangrovi]UZP68686.1 divalent-cation tolerance protein CutA [Desulfovibrio mangrovi]
MHATQHSPILVYMTASGEAEARSIGEALVAKRLAACVNILSGIRSIFRWDSKVQDENEVAFMAKTTADRLDELTAVVKDLHSYEVPCIVALPIVGGSAEFIDWIRTETTEQG